MHVAEARFVKFKRFTDLTITEIPSSAKLVVVTGPNGSGKSAIFEGFNQYRRASGGWGEASDPTYFPKTDKTGVASTGQSVSLSFHEGEPPTQDARRKSFWIRSAYRHEPAFDATQMQKQVSALEDPGHKRLIEVEQTVRKNYERLSSLSLQALYDPANDDRRVAELREQYIGKIQASMRRVFGDLILRSPGDPLGEGTFFFDK